MVTIRWQPRASSANSIREPRRDELRHRLFAAVVEVIAIRNDLDGAGSAGARTELLGRIRVAWLLVAADEKRRALHARSEREHVRRLGEAVEKALGADRVPPSRHQYQLAAPPFLDHRSGARGELLDAIAD